MTLRLRLLRHHHRLVRREHAPAVPGAPPQGVRPVSLHPSEPLSVHGGRGPGAFLLIAAKRTDGISSEIAIHTEQNTDDIKKRIAENTVLTTRVANNTDLLDEIHVHVIDIAKKIGADMGRSHLDED